MIVYSDRKSKLDIRVTLDAICGDNSLDALIRLGQLEAAIADAGASQFVQHAFREIIGHAAAWYMGYEPRPCFEKLRELPAPTEVEATTPEGFAWYALYPEQYRRAARRFLECHSPKRCHILGIRSIGTTLSAVVGAELRQHGISADSRTIRPVGHPFDRRWEPDFEITRNGEHWLIVDEGPGLSGSTITSVAEALSRRGIPDNLIVLFPAHDPDPAQFRSTLAAERWRRHRRYFTTFEEIGIVPAGARDLSGGKWRDELSSDVPVQGFLERRKYLTSAGVLWKFAGLGYLGKAKCDKAARLAEAGFGPEVLGMQDGFLLMKWVDAKPVREFTPHLLDRLCDYLQFTAREQESTLADVASVRQMMQVNLEEAGVPLPDISQPDSAYRVRVDGRHLPHEWIQSRLGQLIKVDGYDHFEDHLFPGCQPIEWDIAGAIVEFDLDAPPQPCRNVDFWTCAYAAFRLGYATMGGDEFSALREHYRRWVSAPAIERVRSRM